MSGDLICCTRNFSSSVMSCELVMSLNLSCEETWPSLPRTKANPFPWLQKDQTCDDVHVQCIHQVWKSVDVGIVESDYPDKMQDMTMSTADTVSDSDAFLCVGQSNTKCDRTTMWFILKRLVRGMQSSSNM